MNRSLAITITVLGAASVATADGFNIDQDPNAPDATIGFITVGYDAGSDQLTANGFLLSLRTAGSTLAPTGNIDFNLTATVTETGDLTSGDFSVNGRFDSLGFMSGSFLTGDLTMLMGPSDALEFLFDVTGGDGAPLYAGRQGGMILSQLGGFNGDWTQDWNASMALIDIGVDATMIPLPLPVAMSGAGLVLTCGRRRRLA